MRTIKYKRSIGENTKETGELCPKCGRSLVFKVNSIKGTDFIACSGYPDCKYTCNVGPDYRSRLEKVLDLFRSEYKWEPDCDCKVYSLLEKIYIYEPKNKKKTSNDEIMFLIGAFHCIDKSFGDPKNQIHIYLDYVLHNGKIIPVIRLDDPYKYWNGNSAPSAMAIVPQGEFVGYPNKHHDFLIFSSSTRSPKQDEWNVKCAIEVDYAATHIFYKYKDDARDRLVKYPVLRFSDGHTSEYLTWIQKVFSLFDDY